MIAWRAGIVAAAGAVTLLCLPFAPAAAAVKPRHHALVPPVASVPLPTSGAGQISSFTPATADPRLAAALARGSAASAGFRFTPSHSPGSRRGVTVAIRARTTARVPQHGTAIEVAAAPEAGSSVAPSALNLGMSVGWQHFAFSSDISRIDAGGLPGSRDLVDLGLSYGRGRWTGRLSVGADRTVNNPLPTADRSYQLDLGGSFSVTHNFDLTGGVRYREQHESFEQIVNGKRDSQSVYVGTAFRF